MRIFSYKIVRDYGFAPNPFYGVCTLATCKPQVRTSAMPGDIVVGCGSTGNGLAGHVICVLRVSGKCTFQEYWDDPRFVTKRPFFKGSRRRAYGDNIYHHNVDGYWNQVRSHHSFADGTLNEQNLIRDTGSDNVLWSEDFAYFGRNAIPIPDYLREFNGDDLYPSRRSHRSRFSDDFISEVENWFSGLPYRGYLGRPLNW
ncbi:Nmad2 family putative nucleotide modification protein [Inquilinus ginsengisoli]|uniref:Nmad2 family putative nucleotide modification protein n=1 Tax=Inquilinus ginsengisoli TaxID=363840 RepID=UPI0035B544AF